MLDSKLQNLFDIEINELWNYIESLFSKYCSSFGKVSVDKESAQPSVLNAQYPARKNTPAKKTKSQRENFNIQIQF